VIFVHSKTCSVCCIGRDFPGLDFSGQRTWRRLKRVEKTLVILRRLTQERRNRQEFAQHTRVSLRKQFTPCPLVCLALCDRRGISRKGCPS